MKQSLFSLIVASLTIVTLMIAACSSSTTDEPGQQGITEIESQQIAQQYLLNSATFAFDGIEDSLKLTETLYPDFEYSWQFVFQFDSRTAGYGDRTGQMLAQVITSHEAIITVEYGEVKSAILDTQWDMMEQGLVDQDSHDEDGSLSVSELMANPQYETVLTIEGEVSLLGELFCPCFELRSGGEKIQVWHGLMIDDDGNELPPASVEGIENGDWVTVSGKLKQAGQHSSLNDFWAENIIVSDGNPDNQLVGGSPGSCGYAWDANRNGWHRTWDPDSFIPADQKPEWDHFIPGIVDDSISDNNIPQMATAMVISISCEEFQQLEAPAVISEELELNTGDMVTIVLCSNPTTGFNWQEIEITDESVFEVVERSFAVGPDSELVGFPGSETIILKILDEGISTMTIAYSRPWDSGEKGEWVFNLIVNVTGEAMIEDPDSDIGGSTTPAFADLLDREWALLSLGDADNPQTVLGDTQITITFSEEENVPGISFGGSAGCNSYFGSFDIFEKGLVSGPIGATEMWCVNEAIMDQEGQFLSALATVSGYEVDRNILEMSYEKGTLLFAAE